jgi:hypothetical protein
LWRWFAFEQRDGDVVVADGDSISEVKLSTQTEHAREPFCTFLWIAHRQSKAADNTKREWKLHVTRSRQRHLLAGRQERRMNVEA